MAPLDLPSGTRSIDLNVLNEVDQANRKSYFAPVIEVLAAALDERPDASILDVGCSLGGFLASVQARWPRAQCTGVDIQRSLVEQAAVLHPGLRFTTADVLTPESLPGPCDLVTMLGVHSLFDEPMVWLDAVLRACAPGGRIYVFGLFNLEDVDMVSRVRWAGSAQGWQTGWNVWSRRTFDAELAVQDLVRSWSWTTVSPSFEVERWSEDPLHSWTTQVGCERALVNGAQLIHRQAVLEIQRAGREGR